MTKEEIQSMIEAGLPESSVTVEGDDGAHFNAIIISNSFAGSNTLQRQRAVYATLGGNISNGKIHALSMKTYTEEEANRGER